MTYTLKFGRRFDREFQRLDNSVSSQIVKKLGRLREDPGLCGKPLLHTKPQLFELKVEMFRIFYCYWTSLNEAWILSVKHKDECDSYLRSDYSRDIKEF